MGKAANNERKKLRAAFFNNVSVGLIISGTAIPILLFISKISVFAIWLGKLTAGKVDYLEILSAGGTIIGTCTASTFAFFYAAKMYRLALEALKSIED